MDDLFDNYDHLVVLNREHHLLKLYCELLKIPLSKRVFQARIQAVELLRWQRDRTDPPEPSEPAEERNGDGA